MNTLADLKRKLTPGTKVILRTRFGKEINKEREVIHLQTNSIAFKTPESKRAGLSILKQAFWSLQIMDSEFTEKAREN